MNVGLLDICDEIVAVKNRFGLDFDLPLDWGMFDSWDGTHYVATDSIIVWESKDLVRYAQSWQQSGINEHPVFANQVRELPTFGLQDFMGVAIEDQLTLTAGNDAVCRLSDRYHDCFIRTKYYNIAKEMKLDIRRAGEQYEYVFFTKGKCKSTADTNSVVVAAVCTLKE